MIPPLIFTRSYRNKTFPLLPNISSPLLENLPSNSRCGVSFREGNIPTIPAFSPLDFSRIGATTEEAIIRNNLPPTERSARAPSERVEKVSTLPLSSSLLGYQVYRPAQTHESFATRRITCSARSTPSDFPIVFHRADRFGPGTTVSEWRRPPTRSGGGGGGGVNVVSPSPRHETWKCNL